MENYDPTLFNPLSADNEFIQNLRNSLQQSYETGLANLENTRKLGQTSIMSNANKAGMLYSNFPQREKIKYDTYTYAPALTNLRNSYQTGLDSLRNAGVNAANQVAYYQQMIDHYNSLPTSSPATTPSTSNSSASDSTTSQELANLISTTNKAMLNAAANM